jgi:hypothetical protein
MNFSQVSMRGGEIWHIWKQHHLIECFWKILKSIFHIRAMQLLGNGLYTALLIKVFAVSPQKFVAKNPCHDGLP